MSERKMKKDTTCLWKGCTLHRFHRGICKMRQNAQIRKTRQESMQNIFTDQEIERIAVNALLHFHIHFHQRQFSDGQLVKAMFDDKNNLSHFYRGKVRKSNKAGCQVRFDDGELATLSRNEVSLCTPYKKGQHVECFHNGKWQKAIVGEDEADTGKVFVQLTTEVDVKSIRMSTNL